MSNKPISRMTALANIWMKYGCPEKMTIHIRSTGETITLIDGLPVRDNAENNPLLMRSCKAQNQVVATPPYRPPPLSQIIGPV